MSLSTDRAAESTVSLCLTGDVMCGRGIDQIMQHPGDPTIHEAWLRSARRYVELAEQRHGPIPRGVDAAYVWGEHLASIEDARPDAFIVNLETAVTARGTPWPGKGIQYRMHPANVECLTAVGIDVAALANNHVLDWSQPGLTETLDTLDRADLATAGAGRHEDQAWEPAIVEAASGAVRTLAVGTPSSGIPPEWAASADEAGIALVSELSDRAVDQIAEVLANTAGDGDVVVLSVHWGGNWGYQVPVAHQWFARQVIARAGVDVVHGHSSHHPLGIEVYQGKLILYGCGDLLTDYEGIRGHEHFRGDLGALYLAMVDAASGTLRGLELLPSQVRRFQLVRPSREDVRWLGAILDRESAPFGTRVSLGRRGRLVATW